MTARYLRCDKCDTDFPENASDYKDHYKLEADAIALGWTTDNHPSAYNRKHYCKECST